MSSKPIGGVDRVILRVASGIEATSSTQDEGVELPLIEDASTYTQHATWMGAIPIVTHRLQVTTTLDCDIAQIASLQDALFGGFSATLYMACGECVELFDDGQTQLYLRESSVEYGSSPLDRPSRVWIFEGNNNY